MNVLDLFSGIGGFSLGLERAGMRTVAFCEIEPFCRKIIAKNFPGRPIWGDVRTLRFDRNTDNENEHGRSIDDEARPRMPESRFIDLICGGFPCQDISVAGKGTGIAGERSGLWGEYARIVGEIRPRYVIVENVAALLGRGLERVLGDLAALGYDAEWHCIPASAVGAPHIRDRIWIVAYPDGAERGQISCARQRLAWSHSLSQWQQGTGGLSPSGEALANAAWDVRTEQEASGTERHREWAHSATSREGWWAIEPDVGRVANGIPGRVDRLRSLGNAVVPQIPEIIGRAIMQSAAGAPPCPAAD